MDETEETLSIGQVCVALKDFEGSEVDDLSFITGENIIIVKPTEVLFWYVGKNSSGQVGIVPSSYLQPIRDEEPPPIPPKPQTPVLSPEHQQSFNDTVSPKHQQSSNDSDTYELMNSCGPAPIIPSKKKTTVTTCMTEEEKEMMRILERDKKKRYATGTLVVATATFYAEKPQDMTFRVHDEMLLLKPTQEYCWYYAQKVDNPSIKGVIPITHVRLVYMSDDEDDGQIYNKPKEPGHDKLYDDLNDFISSSGWFSFPNMVLGKEAQLHLLARKAGLDYQTFVDMKKAVYVLSYRKEKMFVGKADELHVELMKHFECFGKKRSEIREIDDELCHHTDSLGWNLKVHEVSPDQDLELEWSKKVIEHESLVSSDTSPGINEHLTFTDMSTFDKFWDWLSPN